ncbi:hypothetical protein [Paenibacillus harenae]|uniref:hypothetical protein n=1 Tax=Paenibacillus harenae TaxID=306543 RepID=UPI0003FF4EFD|nr:hypothetical protein [Paenibacillus harenae]
MSAVRYTFRKLTGRLAVTAVQKLLLPVGVVSVQKQLYNVGREQDADRSRRDQR